MNNQVIECMKKIHIQKIGNAPVVVLPLAAWEEIEDFIEETRIERSKFLKEKIARARGEKKMYSASEVKKILKR